MPQKDLNVKPSCTKEFIYIHLVIEVPLQKDFPNG